MKSKDLAGMGMEELRAKLVDLKKELMKLNTQVATGSTLKESGKIPRIRKTIARINTIIKNKEEESKHE